MVDENWHISGAGFRWMTRRYRICTPAQCPKGRYWIRRNAGKFKALRKFVFEILGRSWLSEKEYHKRRRLIWTITNGNNGRDANDGWYNALNKKGRMIHMNKVWLYPMARMRYLFWVKTSRVEKFYYNRAPLDLKWSEYIAIYIHAVKACLKSRRWMYIALDYGMAAWVAAVEDWNNQDPYDDSIPF